MELPTLSLALVPTRLLAADTAPLRPTVPLIHVAAPAKFAVPFAQLDESTT